MQVPANAHMAVEKVAAPAGFAFDRLSDAKFVGEWALGSMGLCESERLGVHEGTSLFDKSRTAVEIRPSRELLLIDYLVGTIENRSPRIFIRIAPAEVVGLDTDQCLVALHAWRDASAGDEAWRRTCASHEAEILLIQARLQQDYRQEQSG